MKLLINNDIITEPEHIFTKIKFNLDANKTIIYDINDDFKKTIKIKNNELNFYFDKIKKEIDNGSRSYFFENNLFIKVPKKLWIVANNIKIINYNHNTSELIFTTDDNEFIKLCNYIDENYIFYNNFTKKIFSDKPNLYKMKLLLPEKVNNYDTICMALNIFEIFHVDNIGNIIRSKIKCICKHIRFININSCE